MSPATRLLPLVLFATLAFPPARGHALDAGLGSQAAPDIVGPGTCVSSVGNVWMKTTNIGVMGNPFLTSPDPSAQWPGSSGVQYLGFWSLWVGAKNPEALDPLEVRRVSHLFEWRPPSLAPEDRIYSAYEGQANGRRDFDDDGDGQVDEEFLNGKDDDHDGNVDEDFAAISQQMCTCEMRDDTEQAVAAAGAEQHVPFGLLVRQSTYAFAAPGANDFVAVDYRIVNQSGHGLDSAYVGFFVDTDIGPVADDRLYADDMADPRVPQGDYPEDVPGTDPRFHPTLCTRDTIRVNGFAYADDDGDNGRTNGAAAFLLLGHTTDPTGRKAPSRVGFRMYRTYVPGTPYVQGGQPTVDIERYETLSSTLGIDPLTGFISEERADGAGADYRSICSVGPFVDWQDGEEIAVEVAYVVQRTDYTRPLDDPRNPSRGDPERWQNVVRAAIEAQKTFRGGPVRITRFVPTPDQRGRETPVIAPPGQTLELSDCRDPEGAVRIVDDREPSWFDVDCDWCTGLPGHLDQHWLAAAPPPGPIVRLTPGHRRVTIEWDNTSETVADPSSGLLDVKAYRIWKASNFTRPVGSSGPGEELWALLAEYRIHDEARPLVDSTDTDGDGRFDATTKTWPVLLDVQSGRRIVPVDLPPLTDETGDTLFVTGNRPYTDDAGAPRIRESYRVPVYPAGRYRFEDPNVLNGFVYFYAVTAVDSTGQGDVQGGRGTRAEQEGGRSATERDGVTPQASTVTAEADQGIRVVPNPYRGRAQWDLTPSAADPTGSHIDFLGMPPGAWTLRIFTLAGDLVQVIRNSDTQVNGKLQQETESDGQASWNLVSRNGQDVASGIYLFSVEGDGNTQRGKFVLIR